MTDKLAVGDWENEFNNKSETGSSPSYLRVEASIEKFPGWGFDLISFASSLLQLQVGERRRKKMKRKGEEEYGGRCLSRDPIVPREEADDGTGWDRISSWNSSLFFTFFFPFGHFGFGMRMRPSEGRSCRAGNHVSSDRGKFNYLPLSWQVN